MAARSPAVPRNGRDRPSAARTGHARTSGHRRGPPAAPVPHAATATRADRPRHPTHRTGRTTRSTRTTADNGHQQPTAGRKGSNRKRGADGTSATVNGPLGHSPEPKRRNQPLRSAETNSRLDSGAGPSDSPVGFNARLVSRPYPKPTGTRNQPDTPPRNQPTPALCPELNRAHPCDPPSPHRRTVGPSHPNRRTTRTQQHPARSRSSYNAHPIT